MSPDGPGWVVIQSRILNGEQMIWIRDHDVHVPEILEGLVKYTPDELRRILRLRSSSIAFIHEAKRIFNGQVSEVYDFREKSKDFESLN